MEPISLREILQITGGKVVTATYNQWLSDEESGNADPELIPDLWVRDVVIDSRSAAEGSLFVAIQGERVDGHRYMPEAFRRGAAVSLASKPLILVEDREEERRGEESLYLPPEGCAIVMVADTVTAMGQISRYYKDKINPFTVGITGSVGKTSCKDMIAAALSGKLQTNKTQGNLNSVYGVPLTLFAMTKETQAIAVEMGMEYPGEIDYMASLIRPEVGVITNVGTAHIEHFGSEGRQGILKAKLEIAGHIREGGVLMINGDDTLLQQAVNSHREEYNIPENLTVRTFGFREGCDARVQVSEHTEDALLHVVIDTKWHYDFTMNILGRHMALNAAAAILSAEAAGLSQEEIVAGLSAVSLTPHRLERVPLEKGLLIDDAYNAGPSSMIGALETLSLLPGVRRKVAILGDVFELGGYAEEGHREVGRFAAGLSDISLLVCVGENARYIAEEANLNPSLTVLYYPDLETLTKNLFTILQEDDIILIKASHGMEFSRIRAQLTEGSMEEALE